MSTVLHNNTVTTMQMSLSKRPFKLTFTDIVLHNSMDIFQNPECPNETSHVAKHSNNTKMFKTVLVKSVGKSKT